MILIYSVTFLISMVLLHYNMNIIASVLIISLAIFLYINDVIKTKNILNIKALFSIGFLIPFGLSLLKLSNLSTDYSLKTIISVFSMYFCIYLGYEYHNVFNRKKEDIVSKNTEFNFNEVFVYRTMLSLMAISFVSFLIEAIKMGFIPLLIKNTPHAYSTFHIFMLHYLTTIYIFVPAVATIYMYIKIKQNHFDTIIKLRVICSILFSVAMSILLVSRAQLISSLIYLTFMFIILFVDNIKTIYNSIKNNLKKDIKQLIITSSIIIVLLILITIRREHSVSYLKGIFDMKKNFPIFITQPYMYLAHGFENFNYLVNSLEGFTYGLRMFLPIWTLSFIKFFFPAHIVTQNYIIKEELTNTTLIYDVYGDFGIVGIIIFGFILGLIFYKMEKSLKEKNNNPFFYIFYIQIAQYSVLSFFQPFYSLTNTWTYFLLTMIFYYLYDIITVDKK